MIYLSVARIQNNRKRLYECEEKDSTLVIYFYGISSAVVIFELDV